MKTLEPVFPIGHSSGNERYRLLICLAIALLIHVLAFLLLAEFTPHRQLDRPPRALGVVLLKAAQANPLASTPKFKRVPKPQLLRDDLHRAEPQPLPILLANESPSSSVAVTQTMRNTQDTVNTPVPQGAVVSPRFDTDYLSNPAPEYPQESRIQVEEGRVILRILVTEDGRPNAVTVYRSSGFPHLDQASIDAVWRWKFVPARQDGKAVAAAVIVPINFTLRR
jgi:protein TonB